MKSLPIALALAAACSEAPAPPWQLSFADEFDGPAGAPPDPTRWAPELGGGGWGNQELQSYTAAPENLALDGNGRLVITARRNGTGYTSGRITSKGKFAQQYGRFEARLQLPTGRGLWPAFWMLGADIDERRWPACGEIDIVEQRGATPWRISGAVHGPGHAGGNALIGGWQTPKQTSLHDTFAVYAVEWEPGEIRFYVDGHRYHTVRASRLPPGAIWVYDHPFFLLLNLAVGGTFGGPPDASTPLPMALIADYVRVYTR